MSGEMDDVLSISVDGLIDVFQRSLSGLTVWADEIQLNWSDDWTSPSWERLTQELYRAFVVDGVAADVGRMSGDADLPPYDIDVQSYAEYSWIGLASEPHAAAFVRFVSRTRPFDTVQVAVLDSTEAVVGLRFVQSEDAQFVFVRRSRSGALCIIEWILAYD